MRHLILILMIALLPLRGWTADVMTVSMAVQQVATHSLDTEASDPFDAGLMAGMPADCAMQMAWTQAPEDGSVPAGHGCTTCQLCMAVVTGYPTLPFSTGPLPQALQHMGSTSFTSAERASGFKPPIS